jgi:nitroreductase
LYLPGSKDTEVENVEVFEAVRTVLATRSYRLMPLPADTVHRIVEAARLTASSMNKQPWHFIVVDERQDLEQLGRLAKTGPYLAEAGMAVAVAIEDTRFSVSDASRAIQSMILTAWSEGIASNWVGFFGLDPVEKMLGLPAELRLLAIIAFGYDKRSGVKGKKRRKPFDQVVHHGRFGQPFSG